MNRLTHKTLDATRNTLLVIVASTIRNIIKRLAAARPHDGSALDDSLKAWIGELAEAADAITFADRWAGFVAADLNDQKKAS